MSRLVEPLEARTLMSGDPVVEAYRARAAAVLQSNVSAAKTWAATQTGVGNLNEGSLSVWTAAAAYSAAGSDAAALSAAHLLLANLMQDRVVALFSGGNDGWEAWATADTYLRYRPLIEAAPGRYAPAGYPTNGASADGKYSLDDLCRIVLTQSYYAPIDSTSNHVLMNATARYLAEQAFPGQVVKGYNNSTTDPTGAGTLQSIARSIVTGGPGEYLSPNYGAFNWAEFLSVHQLTRLPGNADLASRARVAFETALAMNAAWWMNGTVAGPVGRGYPNTGAWAASSGDSLTWTYYGGDYGEAGTPLINADNTDIKTLGVLASVAQFGGTGFSGYTPPTALLKLTQFATPFVTRSNFGTNHQYAYNAGQWTSYNESYKGDAFGPYQANWRARTQWTKLTTHDYDAVAWVAQPSTNPTANANGSWTYVDPYTLQTWPLSGSGTYHGSSVFSDMMQHLNTTFQVYNIPPLALAGTPGGTIPARGALIYLPVPKVIATGQEPADGDGWMRPVLSADGRRLFVGYNSVFMVFVSSAPISVGTRNGFQQFYNIHGGTVPGQQADPNSFLQFAVAQETFSPGEFAGTTLQERFANFMTALGGRRVPELVKADTHHPTFRYQDDKATLTSEFAGIERYGDDPKAYTKGVGEEFIGGPGNVDPRLVDYANWPLLHVSDLAGNVLLDQPEDSNMTVTVPGEPARYYDYNSWTVSAGAEIGLRAVSNAGGQITVSWKAGLGATSFTVQRSTDTATWTTLTSTLPATATVYTDTGLTQGTAYYYRITPNGTPLGTSFPVSAMARYNAPTNLAMTLNSASQITLTWTNNASRNDGVQLQFSPDGYSQWQWLVNLPASFASRTVTYTDFTGGERLFYRALAYSNDGPNGTNLFSPPSNVVGTEFSAAHVGGTVSMPRGLSASATRSQITLSWTPTATNATATRIERSLDGISWSVLATNLPPGVSGYTDTAVVRDVTYRYRVASVSGAMPSAYSQVVTAIAADPNAPPTFVGTPLAVPMGTTGVSLSASATDDGGDSWLTYGWRVAAGPGVATFSANHTAPAKNTVASFNRAGTYTLAVTAIDSRGLSTSRTIEVFVPQVATTISVTPGNLRLAAGGSRQLSAVAVDQFGMAMATQPTFVWATTSGTVSGSGLFTAPALAGLSIVTAAAGTAVGIAQLHALAVPAPLAEYSFEDGTGTTVRDSSTNTFNATLSAPAAFSQGVPVRGITTGGLTPGTGGAVIGNPAALNFAGAITLSAWVRPASTSGIQTVIGHGNASNPNAEVFLRTNGATYQVGAWNGSTAQASATLPTSDLNTWVFLAGTYDPATQRWTLYRNGVQVAQTGTTTLGAIPVGANWVIGENSNNSRNFAGSIDEVRIANVALSAAQVAALCDAYLGPTFVQPAAASVSGPNTAALTAVGADRAGEALLRYTWTVVGPAPGSVSFAASGTNAARSTSASFSAPGRYRLAVIAANASGNATSSFVDVDVTFRPTGVALAAGSDSGATGDALTNLNNATPDRRLGLVVTGTVAGSTVRIYAGGSVVGSAVATGATTTVMTDGLTHLPDGAHALTATQTPPAGAESVASPALAITIDTVAPTLAVPDAPAAITADAVGAITLAFSEPVLGLSLPSLTLVREGAAVGLGAAQSPTVIAASTWTVGELTSLTSRPGRYAFSLSATAITDTAGNALAAPPAVAWAKYTLDGSAQEDNFAVTFTSATTASVVVGSAAAFLVDVAGLPSLAIRGNGGADSLFFGGAIPASSLAISVAGSFVLSASVPLPQMTITGAGTVASALRLTAASLTVDPAASLRLTGTTATPSVFSSLTVSPSALLDVGRAAIVVKGASASIDALRGTLAAGVMRTSEAMPGYTTLALRPNLDGSTPLFTTFADTPVGPTDVLLAYAYLGDTDLNAALDPRDYARVIEGFSTGQTGWAYGDVDHSGGGVSVFDVRDFFAAYQRFNSGVSPLRAIGTGSGMPVGPFAVPTSMPARLTPVRPLLPVRAGGRLGPVTLTLRDAAGRPVPTTGVQVRVSLVSGPEGGSLSGVMTARLRRGRVSFSGLSLDRPGTYELRFEGTGLTGVTIEVRVEPARPPRRR